MMISYDIHSLRNILRHISQVFMGAHGLCITFLFDKYRLVSDFYYINA